MTGAERKTKDLLAKQTTEQLLAQWELTSICNDENIPRVRGWLMEELKRRNPKGFNEWLESDLAEDSELRNYMK